MSDAEDTRRRVIQLKTKFPHAGADFRERCQQAGLTMVQAETMHDEKVCTENERLRCELAAAKAELEKFYNWYGEDGDEDDDQPDGLPIGGNGSGKMHSDRWR